MSDEELQQICDNYNICYIVGNLPSTSKAFTFNYGDKYLVVVSDKCSKEQQRKSLIHELVHITEGHFEQYLEDVDNIEHDTKNITNDIFK